MSSGKRRDDVHCTDGNINLLTFLHEITGLSVFACIVCMKVATSIPFGFLYASSGPSPNAIEFFLLQLFCVGTSTGYCILHYTIMVQGRSKFRGLYFR